MKIARFALFVLVAWVVASCGQRQADIIESSTNGLSGVRMPLYVTFKEEVELASAANLQKAVSFSPAVGFDVYRTGLRMLRIVPKAPLESDTYYKIGIDAGLLTDNRIKGTASFGFSTPVLRHTCNDAWLQLSDEGTSYVLVGEVVSSDWAASEPIERAFEVKGVDDAPVAWTHADDGRTHQYTVSNIVPRSDAGYTLTLAFDYDEPKSIDIEVPQKGEYSIIGHNVTTDPLAIVVTFSEPIRTAQDMKNLIRFDTRFRTSVDKNRLYIYPEAELAGDYQVQIGRGVLNSEGKSLSESYTFTAVLPSRAPAIRFTGKGSILPSSNNANILFESVNYGKARVRVRRIYTNNLLQFFQQNNYNDTYYSSMEYTSRVVRDTTIDLSNNSTAKLDRLNTFSLDIGRLLAGERRAIHLFEIRGLEPLVATDEEAYDYDYYFGDYRTYRERSKSVIASDIGIIFKSTGQNKFIVYTTDLVSAKPKAGCKVRVYDRVNQLVAEGTTAADGRLALDCEQEPYIVLAEAGEDASLVKVERGLALSLSNFDVGGTTAHNGIKGFVFGERGVWRPGDDIHLTLIVSATEPLPATHPASLELYNPNGQLVQSAVSGSSSDGIYTFLLKTAQDAPTGMWLARIGYGGTMFEKSLRVDAIKPNRMKIEMHLGDDKVVEAGDFKGTINAKWLHGTPAGGSKATLSAQLAQIPTHFAGYDNYSFDDATKYFAPEEREVFSGTTDANGDLRIATSELASLAGLSRGLISGRFTVRVFEPGGDFSTDQQAVTVSPYDAYLGIGVALQQSDWGDEYLDNSREHLLKVVMLDPAGKPRAGTEQVNVAIYKMSSYWWWDGSERQAQYARNSLNANYKTLEANLSNGAGQVAMRWSPGDYGYFLLRVTSDNFKHSATRIVYVSSSDWQGEVSSVTDAATRLAITADKSKYAPGDKARITIPSSPGARALVSIERGASVMESFWVDCTARQTLFEVPVRGEMSPNVYVSVTLVQPHNNTLNDAPIRLFGVTRLVVEDPARKLQPQIEMPESVRPESEITIRVREQNGRKMSYVLALVDEGLLGLTRFRTPDPYAFFNATEALGINTWDLFDHVIGAYGARIEQMLSIGGDDEENAQPGVLRAQRFKPVVQFIDAQTLAAGKTNTHRITLPPYFGSVRVMVVASDTRAFGMAEKAVAVKKPLLVQATMPRVVSTGEEIEVPATLFALENGVGKVDLRIGTNEFFTVVGPQSQSTTLAQAGEQVVSFRLKAGNATGIGKIKVTATCSNDSATSEIELDVREPNPAVTISEEHILNAGESLRLKPLKSTGRATLELSSMPAVDLSRRIDYLVSYPHGCIEQITSGAFPQLYLSTIMACSAETLQDIDRNIKSTLARLGSYQLSDGAFAYWSGSSSRNEWGTAYATHFMIEASKYGYGFDRQMLDRALRYLRTHTSENLLTQAYAQYVLALGGAPDRGAMNRLRDQSDALSNDAKWLLAAAYTLDGNRKVAEALIEQGGDGLTAKVDRYDYTYNSSERQMAIVLMTHTLLGHQEQAFRMVVRMSEILKSNRWLSTQSTAWMLNTLSAFASSTRQGVAATVGKERVQTDKSVASRPLTAEVTLTNNGTGPLYAVVSHTYTPAKGEETAARNNIGIEIRYKDMSDVPIDPRSISQATDFYAVVTVTNLSGYENYTNLALTHIVPAGWEITSGRDLSTVTYQDIRDDRVLSYFDLRRGERKQITIKLTATYKGRYYLPSIYCEAMYDDQVRALVKGEWIEVK